MRIVVIIALVISVVLVQVLGLEPCQEVEVETKYTRLSNPPATSLFPMYLSSLFMGPLRAIMVNGLWMSYENAYKEKKFHLMKELTDFITILQPRNEGIWSTLAYDFFIQVAPDEHDPLVRYKKWERYGVEKLFGACEINPNSAVLSWDMAIMLMRKALPNDNAIKIDYDYVFNRSFIKYFLQDTELQRKLQGSEYNGNASPFELSSRWFQKSTDQIHKQKEKWVASQFYVVISPHSNDQWIRVQCFRQAMYLWYQGKVEESKEWLKKARAKAVEIANKYQIEHLFETAIFYDSLSDVIGIEKTSPAKFLQEAEKILKKNETLDDGFLWQLVSRVKRELSRDQYEYNDFLYYYTHLIPRKEMNAAIGPESNDIDFYYIHSFNEERDIRSFNLFFENNGNDSIKITVLSNEKPFIQREIVSGAKESVQVTPTEVGIFHLKVESTGKMVPYKIKLDVK